MGNCLKCFQSAAEQSMPTNASSPNSHNSNSNACQTATSLANCYESVGINPNANERCALGGYSIVNNSIVIQSLRNLSYSGLCTLETDELLSSRTPLKPAKANNCDTKRNSFKSLGLLNGSAPTMSDIITTGESAFIRLPWRHTHSIFYILIAVQESMEVSHQTLSKLFDVYKDPDDEEMILTDGIERLCNDLNYQPDEFAILVLAWCLDASQMCRFTKVEFIEGLHKMRADTIDSIRVRLEQTIEMLKADAEMFKQLYRFTFRYAVLTAGKIST